MREAFSAQKSLPTGSPQTPRKLTGQQSLHQLDAPKTNTSIAGSSPKKDSTDSIVSSLQFQKSKKTTTKLGHSPHHHRNSSPNTKYSYSSGSPTLKTDLKTHLERGDSSCLSLTTTTSAVASSSSTGTPPTVFAQLADTTADVALTKITPLTGTTAASTSSIHTFPGELEELQSVLHFPEEVALRITDAEYQLFYQVPPIEYFKHVILELQNENDASQKSKQQQQPTASTSTSSAPSSTSGGTTANTKSIPDLQKRFEEVCSWVSYLIMSQPTPQEQKAAFGCLLRAALSCWNIGNFNGAMEITTGLRSVPLKLQLNTYTEKGKIPVLDFLSAALESAEYERALARGLKMNDCRVIPCYKLFLKDLKEIMLTKPINFSLTAISYCNEASGDRSPDIDVEHISIKHHHHFPVGSTVVEAVHRGVQTNIRTDARSYFCKTCTTRDTAGSCSSILNSRLVNGQVYISDYNGDDHYFTKIGSSGVLTADQIFKIQAVMDHIDSCHQHHHTLMKNGSNNLIDYLRSASLGNRQMAATSTYHPELELEEDYEVEIGNYNPVQPLLHDHGVCAIPISNPAIRIDHHILQIMHHGTTAVIWEPDATSGRSCYAFFRLERSCSSITWQRPSWHRLKSEQEYDLAINPEELVSPRLFHHHQTTTTNEFEPQNPTIDEGFLDLTIAKEVTMGSRNHEYDAELLAAGKRFGLTHIECCVTILYGNSINDNRIICLMCPPMLCRLWYVGLNWIIKGIKRQQRLADRAMLWLKEKYVQLYFEDRMCVEPFANDALKLFGGRDWTTMHTTTTTSTIIPETSEPIKREMSFKFKKKRSVANILGQSIGAINSTNVISSEPDHDDGQFDRRRNESSDQLLQKVTNLRFGAITYETQLDFLDFIALFKSFSLLMRKDLRDLFDQLAVTRKSHKKLNAEKSRSAPELCCSIAQRKIGLLTRNSSLEAEITDKQSAQKKFFDGMCAASIVTNCAGIDTSNTQVITMSTLKKFLETRQMEVKTDDEIRAIIRRHEPDPTLRIEDCLSFEGFARYLMDKDNYAFINERIIQSTSNMDRPLSQYYIASSHNTYLTGHQLKGESSAELYSQVLLTGCRCVELDCWDGDDGIPVIYHGHTFTTKISFKSVVEAINRSAFVSSPYPVILSIENHCSLQQQARMAHIFMTTFGDKLVNKFIFDTDYCDEPMLPSPNQLKNRILIKNKKLIVEVPAPISSQPGNRSNLRHQMSQPGRTSSIISNVSSGSVTEDFSDDEYDDDDDYDNIDEKTFHTIFGSVDERSSRHSLSSYSTPTRRVEIDDKPKKRSSQISRELSDLVNYVQAIKFRGLNPISPQNSVRMQQPMPTKLNSSGSLVTVGSILKTSSISPCAPPIGNNPLAENMQSNSLDSSSAQSETESQSVSTTAITSATPSASGTSHRKLHHVNVNHPCYQCSSINEASAKKLCRKHPLALIAHTESQLMRTYPAGLRIDSSNFNPVFFWAFGIQLVALNYQTDDLPLSINTGMFEENGSCGYVLKPDVLWDQSHLMYRRFNPLEKEFDGLHSSQIVINIVSGQFVQQTNLQASTYVEVEMIGIPVDCSKKKTRVIRRNALNPIWNDTFFFKVMFHDLAFLKFSVFDNDTNHMVSQRVIPLKCLRPGYRHVRLRSPNNQPLSMAALFVYSRVEEESLERTSDETDEFCSGISGYNKIDNTHTSTDITKSGESRDVLNLGTPTKDAQKIAPATMVSANIPLRRRMFFVMVYGVVTGEPFTILRATQESTTRELIAQALQKSNRTGQNVNDYILVAEVGRGWKKKDRDLPATQRVLDMHEKPLQAQAMWQGEGRFIFKKIGNDPSSRAWLTSIRSVSERRAMFTSGEENTSGASNEASTSWDDDDTFLVCVYNVSPDIPYAILKAPINATAQDVLAQSLLKARRMEDPNSFVLIEELEYGSTGTGGSGSNTQQRPLASDEIIFSTQANWKTIGRFILQEKSQVTPSMRRHRLAIDKISRGFSISRAAVLSSTSKNPIQPALSDPTTSRVKRTDCSSAPSTSTGHMLGSGIFRAKGNSDKETTSCSPRRQKHREVHSEGEALSEDETHERDLMSTVYRLKKMSIKKLKAWKS